MLYRYLTKEVGTSLLAVIFILLIIALSNNFIHLLAKSAIGQLPVQFVIKVMLLYIPELMSEMLPAAFFVAILLSLGRLHADSEMVVLQTCGVSWRQIIQAMMILALALAVLVGSLTLWLVPQVTEYREKILAEGAAVGVMQGITPGQFQTLNNGQIVFYVEDYQPRTHQMKQVFIAEKPKWTGEKYKPWALLTAQKAEMKQLQDDKFYLTLKQGHRYTGNPGQQQYTVIDFDEYGREVIAAAEPVPKFLRITSTKEIMHSKDPGEKAEFLWRLSMPLTTLILCLLAIPLAKVNPRQGRYAKLLPAIILFIIYYNLLTVCKREISAGDLPSVCLWLMHLAFLALAMLLTAQASGRLYEWRYQLQQYFHNKRQKAKEIQA